MSKTAISRLQHTKEDLFRKDISIFHKAGDEGFVFRRCLLDSGSCGSPGNLISKKALQGITCEINKDSGREVSGLGPRMVLKEFVTLKCRFWDSPQIFEVEFRVLSTRSLFGFDFVGLGCDCLLGSEWMTAHPEAWVLPLWQRQVPENNRD